MEVHYLTELARLAHDLGGSLVRVFTGYQHPVLSYGQQWNLLVRGLRECSRRAAEMGVTIGVQNHHDLAVGFESQYDLVKEVNEPNCKALFDAWAPALHGADLSAAAKLLAPITAHTTGANYLRRPRYRYHPELVNYTAETPFVQAVSMRDGFIDYMRFWGEMYRAGFRGSVAYEMCSPLAGGGSMENLDAHARIFLEMFHEFRAGVTEHDAETTETVRR
jgi:sugar phosphate isomerase/epimerase